VTVSLNGLKAMALTVQVTALKAISLHSNSSSILLVFLHKDRWFQHVPVLNRSANSTKSQRIRSTIQNDFRLRIIAIRGTANEKFKKKNLATTSLQFAGTTI
jgi:hypothetical protein